jgi:hypothetical protein
MVISSTKTTQWVQQRDVIDISMMPTDERYKALARFGKDHNADIVLYVSFFDPKTSIAPIINNVTITLPLTSYLIDTHSGEVLWSENQRLVMGGVASTPSSKELTVILSSGNSDRIMELRRGTKRTQEERRL